MTLYQTVKGESLNQVENLMRQHKLFTIVMDIVFSKEL